MKKFWIINICLTILLLAVAVWTNSQLYGTLWELRIIITIMLLMAFQFAVCIIYSLFRIKDYTKLTIISGLLSIGFMILSMLFIFNGMIWNTDTGTFRELINKL